METRLALDTVDRDLRVRSARRGRTASTSRSCIASDGSSGTSRRTRASPSRPSCPSACSSASGRRLAACCAVAARRTRRRACGGSRSPSSLVLLVAVREEAGRRAGGRRRATVSQTTSFRPRRPNSRRALVATQHQAAWQLLQSGDPKGAERDFAAILKADAGLLSRRSRARLCRARAQGRGRGAAALRSRARAKRRLRAGAGGEGGGAAGAGSHRRGAPRPSRPRSRRTPSLTSLRGRVDVLKFRGVQQNIENARKAADAGNFDEARRGYLAAIAASPESAFLYRELAAIELKAGDNPSALAARPAGGEARSRRRARADAHRRDPREQPRVGEGRRRLRRGQRRRAVRRHCRAAPIRCARRPRFEAMPAEYRAIETSPTVTRAQLAALLGTRLGDTLRRARRQRRSS